MFYSPLLRPKRLSFFLTALTTLCVLFTTGCNEKERVGYDGAAILVFLSHDYLANTVCYTKVPLKTTEFYENGTFFHMKVRFVAPMPDAPELNGPIINGKQQKIVQFGQYDFSIESLDTTIDLKSIDFSGESELTVARGNGWAVKIVHSPEWEAQL